jgi:hypothetical protein
MQDVRKIKGKGLFLGGVGVVLVFVVWCWGSMLARPIGVFAIRVLYERGWVYADNR